MEICPAALAQVGIVRQIAAATIAEQYPHYYPPGAVAYFLAHHGEEQIAQDVAHHCVLLGLEAGRPVGTVTIRGREICRLFVLPTHQGRGYGARLLDAAEGRVAARHGEIWLDASLSARLLYHKRGYQLVECHVIPAGEDFLCYDTMVKRVK